MIFYNFYQHQTSDLGYRNYICELVSLIEKNQLNRANYKSIVKCCCGKVSDFSGNMIIARNAVMMLITRHIGLILLEESYSQEISNCQLTPTTINNPRKRKEYRKIQ
ncbi:hypothetical protein BpHYR1_027606 [Brachionus plicatilis]|uniref:Uncharacterized protein n=1 Tax=Brachionus plicatilis TaxID=10195 RepID=A0A3M7Q6V7_BRAPC|nr:hypothetical protein BpHYR1_027606 [Brachionus plicatilis]